MTVDMFAGVPVNGLDAATAWYERLFGAPPVFRPDDAEAVWEIAEHRYMYIEALPERAGNAVHTLFGRFRGPPRGDRRTRPGAVRARDL
ncbi:hypothetical protein [Nocardiopsis suaedae]|uniref:VOC family protein n=1 Tax=Nocardiopsis suaedae TaxID=3018444 RepID=A0ABT4THY6_9ACTN|nr:hypothetical protein [Nocardiopsis suaedae]MDA2804292.1 hypothetical protein [Nocardiopsis suaedae]